MTPRRLQLFWLLAFILWSGMITLLGWQEYTSELNFVHELAKAEAWGNYNKDLVYRRWAALKGGVYVPVSPQTPPNPYLDSTPERDITTPSGKQLTLVNPAYISRQLLALSASQYGTTGHITSLIPLNPENSPDPWEKEALISFQHGAQEADAIVNDNGNAYLRMMYPLQTEEACLRCHSHQGYRVGDIRGGLSVAIPLDRYLQVHSSFNKSQILSKLAIWFIGSLLLLISYRVIRNGLIAENISKLKAEESERKYKLLFDEATIGFALAETDTGIIVECNQTLADMVGYQRAEIIGQSHTLLHSDKPNQDGLAQSFARHRAEIPGKTLEADLLKKSGEAFTCEIKASRFSLRGKDVMLAVIRDIHEQKRTGQILRYNEEKYRALLNHLHDAVFLHPFKTEGFSSFIEVNDIAVERYGYSRKEFLELSPMDITYIGDANEHASRAVRKKLFEEKQCMFETYHIKKSGELFPVEINASIIALHNQTYILSTVRDISERKQAQERQEELKQQLRQKYKMEAIGLMAGGMAHNFNNNLAIILGSIDLARKSIANREEALDYLESANIGILRARELVRQIAAYSRQDTTQVKPINLSRIVNETMKLLRSTIPTTVTLAFQPELGSEHIVIVGSDTRIQEALINLCTNAVHAMQEHGKIVIHLSSVQLPARDIPAGSDCKPGKFACLQVLDNGCGIASELLDKIFDPFFTTKNVDEGTGMGLATVHGIVNQHKGLIKVTSTPGEGTRFTLYFPQSETSEALVEIPIEDTKTSGQERIMLVDDDTILLDLHAAILADEGYQLKIFSDSEEALAHFTQNPDNFDLVITDQTMPKFSGLALSERIHQIKPVLPIILCTGYSAVINDDAIRQAGITQCCMKPLERDEMLRVIRSVFDR